ncbi:MAG: hypothetical protein AAF462_10520 [Thermodesulfobacteriota bacterium]
MKLKSTVLIASFVVLFGLISCGGGGDGNQCTEIVSENNFMLAFAGCPNDAIKSVCNSFECTFTPQFGGDPPPPEFFAVIDTQMDCSRIDRCVNLDCDLRDENGAIVGNVILSTLEILPGNAFVGAADVNGASPFDFTCDIILP